MNLCIPVNEDKGLASRLSPHFGQAPLFLMIDTETGAYRALANKNLNHGPGGCQPLSSFVGERLDAVVAAAIGPGALDKLRGIGARVFVTEQATAGEALASFRQGTLREAVEGTPCSHHHEHK